MNTSSVVCEDSTTYLFGDGGMVDANGGGEVIGYRRWKRNR